MVSVSKKVVLLIAVLLAVVCFMPLLVNKRQDC